MTRQRDVTDSAYAVRANRTALDQSFRVALKGVSDIKVANSASGQLNHVSWPNI